VQGEAAAEQVAAAIRGFNRIAPGGPVPRPDLLIVARGGGSVEDLWAFNEEVVVRAAAASEIPLISAVGHETDTTLIDFAADRRAPTPTAAAEIAVPVRADLVEALADLDRRQRQASRRLIAERRRHLEGLARGLRGPRELLALASQRFDDVAERLGRALRALVEVRRAQLAALAAALRPLLLRQELRRERERIVGLGQRLGRAGRLRLDEARRRVQAAERLLQGLSYENVLMRGFAVVRDGGGAPVTLAAATAPGMALDIQFKDGRVGAHVDGGEAAPRGPRRRPGPGQGELF
jgi:exodeoxyribonuclease VII large subunit